MVGGFPRKAGMERKDVMAKNVSIYKSQASSLEKNAATGVKASQRILALISCPKMCFECSIWRLVMQAEVQVQMVFLSCA